MTISVDARTPSAIVHALSGSTPPGTGRSMQPFGIAAAPAANVDDTFVPLGGVALDVLAGITARRAALHDIQVTDLAGRVVALAWRDHRNWDRLAEIDDRVDAVVPALPTPPALPDRTTMTETVVDGIRTIVLTAPVGKHPDDLAAEAGYVAALAEHSRVQDELEARLGLPYRTKLAKRSFARLVRWACHLAAMEPQTPAGLKAKAAAQIAVDRAGNCDRWTKDLAASVSRDAVRIAGTAADVHLDPFTGFHDEIMRLQVTIEATDEGSPEQDAAWARWKQIDDLFLSSRPTTFAGAVGALELARREHKQFSILDHRDEEIGTDDRLIQHALVSALDVLRPLMRRAAPAMADLRPSPLPAGIVAGLTPVARGAAPSSEASAA